MSDEAVTRKLTTIFYADVAGYSRLMDADEMETHKQLSAGLNLISGRIEGAGGHVVNNAGDAVLAEFQSVVMAVETAVDIQRLLAKQFADISEDKRLQFRIGLNLGEVIVDRDDIFGTGVNIAARLQELAEPGGIWISDVVHKQVRHNLDLRYDDRGEHRLKNISEPVHSYRIRTDPREQKKHSLPTHQWQSKRRWAIGGALAVCVIAVIVLGWFVFYTREFGSDKTTCTDHLGLPVPCPEGQQ